MMACRKISLVMILVAGLALAGCGSPGGDDKALETAAPPPSANAKPEAPNPNKKMPGPAGMGGGPGMSGAASK